MALARSSHPPWSRLKGAAGDYVGAIRVDLARPDVAAFFKAPAGAQSGFSQVFEIAALRRGIYQPIVYRRTPTGWMSCTGKTQVTASKQAADARTSDRR